MNDKWSNSESVGSVCAPDLRDYRILLFDDNEEWASTTSDYLKKTKNIQLVDIAQTPEDATARINARVYDAVLFDILLEENIFGAGVQGDEWFVENESNLKSSFNVAVTAYPAQIRNRADLIARGVAIVKKREDEEDELYDKLSRFARAKERNFEVLATLLRTGSCAEWGGAALGHAIASEAVASFCEWASTIEGNTEKDVLIGPNQFSVMDLANEAKQGTEVGQRIIKMYLSHLRDVAQSAAERRSAK